MDFRRRRYLWVALIVTGVSILAYWIHDPQEPANGGTALGYTLGVIATFLILWLTWFGVRKRSYGSTAGTVQGWLSAHVNLGLALPVIVLLHAGFQFGFNVHTLALVLLLLVVASGLYGAIVYLKYPERISINRDSVGRAELYDQLEDIDRRSRRVANDLPEQFRQFVRSGISRTQLGSTLWSRIRARDLSLIELPATGQSGVVGNAGQEASLDWLAEQQSRATDADLTAKIGELSGLLRNKRKLLRQLREDLRLQASMELWLYAHVPLTAGLLMALIVHIVTVFLYW